MDTLKDVNGPFGPLTIGSLAHQSWSAVSDFFYVEHQATCSSIPFPAVMKRLSSLDLLQSPSGQFRLVAQ
ncbi:hypothetical protein [Arthrobacter alpinus]|uniref:hypothetical protein n=1 Tax=Arthrobacter alpinus TaxID=656366 RepID=UPI0012FF373C|nr:hypothetical protein [Arthrobacter alpinus]